MPTIFDNITTAFLENASKNGLRDALMVALRGDFCVGYFNLRGWRHIDHVVETWESDGMPPCRLLVGMHRLPQEELSEFKELVSIKRPMLLRRCAVSTLPCSIG
jgi:hypothetical protein